MQVLLKFLYGLEYAGKIVVWFVSTCRAGISGFPVYKKYEEPAKPIEPSAAAEKQ